jgi:hypothetical protein
MRREPEHFGDRDLPLVYIAKKLKEALALEEVFTTAGIDYLVEPDRYRGGLIFQSERIGAFFYTDPDHEALARRIMAEKGYRAVSDDLS